MSQLCVCEYTTDSNQGKTQGALFGCRRPTVSPEIEVREKNITPCPGAADRESHSWSEESGSWEVREASNWQQTWLLLPASGQHVLLPPWAQVPPHKLSVFYHIFIIFPLLLQYDVTRSGGKTRRRRSKKYSLCCAAFVHWACRKLPSQSRPDWIDRTSIWTSFWKKLLLKLSPAGAPPLCLLAGLLRREIT